MFTGPSELDCHAQVPTQEGGYNPDIATLLAGTGVTALSVAEILGQVNGYKDRYLRVPSNLFHPMDPWAVEFRNGLAQLGSLDNATLYEVGCGVGANVIKMLDAAPSVHRILGSDLDPSASLVAASNISQALPADMAGKFCPIVGGRNLLSAAAADLRAFGGRVDLMFGCLPQMRRPKVENETGHPPDALAHYYEGDYGPPEFEKWSLGLIYQLLQQAGSFLNPDGRVVLILAGRPGREVLDSLFLKNGFSRPKVVYQAMTEQHAGTSIASMEEAERTCGIRFEFYDSPHLTDQMPSVSASLARKLFLEEGRSVYHKLLVMEAEKVQ